MALQLRLQSAILLVHRQQLVHKKRVEHMRARRGHQVLVIVAALSTVTACARLKGEQAEGSWPATVQRAREFVTRTLAMPLPPHRIRQVSPSTIRQALGRSITPERRALLAQWLDRAGRLGLTDGKDVGFHKFLAGVAAGLGGLTRSASNGSIEVLVDRSLAMIVRESVLVHELTHVAFRQPEVGPSERGLRSESELSFGSTAMTELPAMWVEAKWQERLTSQESDHIHRAGLAVLHRQGTTGVPSGIIAAAGMSSDLALSQLNRFTSSSELTAFVDSIRGTSDAGLSLYAARALFEQASSPIGPPTPAVLDLGVVRTVARRAAIADAERLVSRVLGDEWRDTADGCFTWTVSLAPDKSSSAESHTRWRESTISIAANQMRVTGCR